MVVAWRRAEQRGVVAAGEGGEKERERGGVARRYGNPLINENLASPRHRLSRLSPVVLCVFTATGRGVVRGAVEAAGVAARQVSGATGRGRTLAGQKAAAP